MNQIGALESTLPQLDAEWEALTRSIEADQQKLNALQQRRGELASRRSAEPATCFTLTLGRQLETLERQMRYVGEEIARKQLLCRALEQQFDEMRLALYILQQRGA